MKGNSIKFFFDIPGGLGNQLFALFAARFFFEYANHEVQPNFTTIDRSHTKLDQDINPEFFKHDKVKIRSNLFTDWLVRIYYPKHHLSRNFLKSFVSYNRRVFEPNHDRVKNVEQFLDLLPNHRQVPMRISGFFADFEFYDRLVTLNRNVYLKTPEQRYLEEELRIIKIKTLGIHLRLGDYLKNPKTIGILSDEYYQSIIEQYSSGYERIILFTNDWNLAQNRVKKWSTKLPINVIYSDPYLNPLEDLLLLSKCSGIIAANSTFSFWAGKFSSNAQVVYPTPFRKDNFTEIASIPKNWISHESDWLENY